jgi:hypothetical protein
MQMLFLLRYRIRGVALRRGNSSKINEFEYKARRNAMLLASNTFKTRSFPAY